MATRSLKGINLITDFKVTETSISTLYEDKSLFSLPSKAVSGVQLSQNKQNLIFEIDEDGWKDKYPFF